jgi:hypothetical protein
VFFVIEVSLSAVLMLVYPFCRLFLLLADGNVVKTCIHCVRKVGVHLTRGVGSDVHKRLYRHEPV